MRKHSHWFIWSPSWHLLWLLVHKLVSPLRINLAHLSQIYVVPHRNNVWRAAAWRIQVARVFQWPGRLCGRCGAAALQMSQAICFFWMARSNWTGPVMRRVDGCISCAWTASAGQSATIAHGSSVQTHECTLSHTHSRKHWILIFRGLPPYWSRLNEAWSD